MSDMIIAVTTLEPLLPAHLAYLQLCNQQPRSITQRRYAILRTRRRAGKEVATLDRDDLAAWQKSIAHLMPRSMRAEITHVSAYLKWACLYGHRADDPTVALIRPRHQMLVPRPISDADVYLALTTAPQPERAWIALGAFCGLRCMEIASLTRECILDGQTPAILRITGKGNKTRIIPLPARVLAELHDAGMPTRGWLFTRVDGAPGPPTAMRVSARLNAHLHALGIVNTAHGLRHRFGTTLYAATRDPFLVAQMMGHSNINSTRGYVQLDTTAAAPFMETLSALSGTIPAP